jgi:predicted Zn-dependent protease with MMP-like domain
MSLPRLAHGCQPAAQLAGRWGRRGPGSRRRLLSGVPARRENRSVIDVGPERFEDLVSAALDGLPAELGQMMRNVAVTVEHGPGPAGLLGLYQGVPLTSRTSHYAGVLPDRITIYRQAICSVCGSEEEVATQVRRTVIHEVGHHFGITDDRLAELGW